MKSQFDEPLLDKIEQCGIIAVLVIDDEDHAIPVAKALLDGGITAMELTLRTPAALGALRNIRREIPEMIAGIGTVLTTEQIQMVHDAGGQFAVAPGTNPRVIQAAQKIGLPFAPGIATPSDIETAVELGCRELKFFPAEPSGGLTFLKSMAAPYAHLGLRYVPLGGVNADNLATYMSNPLIMAVGGSWLAKRDAINSEDWSGIRDRAAQAVEIVKQARAKDKA